MPVTRPLAERFWEKVRVAGPDECWIWMGTRHGKGYGHIRRDLGANESLTMKAHRASWILHHGPIPEGMQVCHRCDNPPCVNPLHLFLGTNKDNADDMVAKGRQDGPKGEEVHTAKLTEELVRLIRSEDTSRWGSITRLAKHYGVQRHTISKIIKRQNWKHV